MQGIWTTDRIRAAEERLLAATPDGALMRKAAFGLSVSAAAMLAGQTGSVSGSRVVLLVGAGNNGGDALWAGVFLRKRGVAVSAVLSKPERAHAEGLAALRRAGGRILSIEDSAQWISRADLVIDGIVGISAKGPLRPDAAQPRRAAPLRRPLPTEQRLFMWLVPPSHPLPILMDPLPAGSNSIIPRRQVTTSPI